MQRVKVSVSSKVSGENVNYEQWEVSPTDKDAGVQLGTQSLDLLATLTEFQSNLNKRQRRRGGGPTAIKHTCAPLRWHVLGAAVSPWLSPSN